MKPRKRLTLAAACAAAALFGSDIPVRAEMLSIDVGLEQPLTVDNSKPLKIALFMRGQSNAGLQAVVRGARTKADELGIPLDVFDARFDDATMVNQMQNALLRDYTAWVVFPTYGSAAVCDMISSKAPAANILVSISVEPACVDDLAEGEAMWAAGTIGYVGGNETVSIFRALVERAAKDHPQGAKVGIVHGPRLDKVAKALIKAADDVAAGNPNFVIAVRVESAFDTPEALAKSTTMFQAHPDLDVVVAQFTPMTRGVLAALETSGTIEDVAIYEKGGTDWSAEMIKAGKVAVTSPLFLETNGATSVANIHAVYNGAPIPKYDGNDGHAPAAGEVPGEPVLIDASNVDSFVPEFN